MDDKKLLDFTDENGEDYTLEMIDSFEYKENTYVALVPPEEDGEIDAEVLIMRVEKDVSGEDILVYIDDDEELDAAFDILKDRLSDEYDFLD